MFYHAVQELLGGRKKQRARAIRKALELVPAAHLSYKVSEELLERVCSCVIDGNLSCLDDTEGFASSAFEDLSGARSLEAHSLFRELESALVGDRESCFFKITRARRCRHGGGLVTVYTSNPRAFVRFLDQTPGRGKPSKAKLIH